MHRRAFLIASARLGIAAGVAGLVEACLPSPTPSRPVVTPLATDSPPATDSPIPTARPVASSPATPGPAAHRDPQMTIENLRPGDRGWNVLADPTRRPGHTVAGFASAASVVSGETLDLHLGAMSPGAVTVRLDWYRLGWYRGIGGRLVRTDPALVVPHAAPPHIEPTTGLAEAPWPPVLSVTVPEDWPTGTYRVVMVPSDGQARSALPFLVRPGPRARRAAVLFVSATATWQAYNEWGGADLYGSSRRDRGSVSGGRRAVQVSYDRPYQLYGGVGYQGRWELPFIRWQEREGRDVDYCADIDLELHPDLLTGRRLIVFAGHHEYWSRPMRTALEAAIGAGVNVAFLSGNEMYWQVRLGASPLGSARRITCYKSAKLDPIAATRPDLTTTRWRDRPVNDPEAPVIGEMYGHVVVKPADWVVSSSDHWLYEATGLADGDHITNLVGQEYDTFFPDLAHPGTTILARSPVLAQTRDRSESSRYVPYDDRMHNATIYTANSGATILAAGTFQWSWALDDHGDRSYRGVATPVDRRVQIMTRNLFDRLGDGPA